ncbi:ABC transporter substrate-binding protein [bacterium]|nr:ABC transporter substrate-binding protein [bacterium]MBU1064552.1 ABC transporter substrate-binding protein [bacterium]MBU1874164.1 ABC transporter substrate-binding protein [bacterium]
MKNIIKQLWLVISLILVASFILLVSDREQRLGHGKQSAQSFPSIAIMQISSTTLLDSHVAGVLDRLEEKGYRAADGKNIHLFNPQGDYATANAIAREIVNSPYDIVITSSTTALQVFSKVNISVQKTHVFGAVTDPYGAGVGISGPEPDQHPPYIAGVGTFQPVKTAISLAYEMNPGLKRLGVVWNPGEQCSEACLNEARGICKELGIELVEAVAVNTSEVSDAARSLIAKNVDAIWIGGDTVAMASIGLIINLAKQAGIPVITNDPMDAEKGALFGLGADYHTVGQYTADIAVAIMEGQKASAFRIENVIPEQLNLNREVLTSLKNRWKMTPSVRKLLARQAIQPAEKQLAPEPGKTYRVGLSYIVPAPVFEIAIRGFEDGLEDLGFINGENLELITQHANGDMSFLSQSTTNLIQRNPDILVAMSTPSLSSAIAHSDGLNIAFGIVSAPLEAGAGKSFDDHLPHVTGIVQLIPTEELFEWTLKFFPEAKRIGALYNPSEANSAKEIVDLKKILDRMDLKLVKVAVYNTSEIPENIRGLLAKNVDLVFSMADNTVANGMPAMVKACEQQRVPIIAEDIALMGTGAIISCAPGPYSDGRDLAELTARILLGESPGDIPIVPGKKNELTLDLLALKKAGIIAPVDLLKRADVFFNIRSETKTPAKIVLVNLIENASLLQAIDGVETALFEMGLRAGKDFTLKKYCAQGDMSQLSQILDRVQMDKPDALITVTTPVFIAAVKKNFDFPLIFTVASDPEKLGLFKIGRPNNVCGIHDDPPVDQVLAMAKKYDPALGAVGIIYDASQMNALISVEKLRKAGVNQHINILEATVTTVSDLPMATQSVIQRGARALIISADNLATTGFPTIHKVAQGAGIPIYVTNIDLIEKGAAGGVGDNYFDWGRQSGQLAVRVLAGVSPSELPIMSTQENIRVEPKTRLASVTRSEPFKLRIVLYSETEFAERCRDGLIDGIKQAGYTEGRDYQLTTYNAQGDMSTLSSIMTTVKSDHVDLLMVVSTPTLQAALRQAGEQTKIVFTGVGDGVKAGAGKSEADHLPNVTGISTRSAFDGMARIIKKTLPDARRIGTLFTPGEINSVLYKDWFKEALEKEGLVLVAVPVSSSADVAQSAIELCSKKIHVLGQVVDNLTRPGFALIARKAAENNLPVYVFDSDQMKYGGVICLARDYYDAGLEAAEKAVRILKGENPKDIPFNNTQSEKLILNPELAEKYKLRLSKELMEKATIYTPK